MDIIKIKDEVSMPVFSKIVDSLALTLMEVRQELSS